MWKTKFGIVVSKRWKRNRHFVLWLNWLACLLIIHLGINQHLNQRRCTAVSALLTASAAAFIFVHCKFYTVRSAECSMHCKALQWAQTLCIASAWASQAYIQSSTLWIVHCLLWTQTQSCAQLASSCSAMIRIDHRVVITLAHHSQWQTRQTKRPSWAHHRPCRNIIIDITINIINTRPRFCKDGVLPPHWG